MSQLGVDAIVRELAKVGIALKREWVSACVAHLERSDARFATMPLNHRVNECYLQFLEADMHLAGSGCLPAAEGSVASTRDGQLSGRFVLQADEAVDVGASFNDRYAEKPAKVDRTLKLSLTDGVTRVVAYEYRPIAQLGVHVSAGCKMAVVDARVRDGALFLQPENVTTLGGVVERLEAARRRAVDEWRQPNRPKLGAGARGGVERGGREAAVRAAATSGFGLDDGGGGCAGGAAEHAGGAEYADRRNAGVPSVETAAEAEAAATEARAAMEAAAAAVKAAGEVAEAAAPFAVEAPVSSAAPDAAAAPDPAAEPAAPVGRIKRRRIVRIDDSDEDPTQTPKPPPTTRPSQPSRLGTRRSSSAAAADAPPPAHAGPPSPPPRWALQLCAKDGGDPFTYVAAVASLRRSEPPPPPGASARSNVVVLHGWMSAVGTPRRRDGGVSIAVRVQDGTGSMAAELPHDACLRIMGTSDAEWRGMDESTRREKEGFLRRYLTGFMGKVAARVSAHDDGAPARVTKIFGPADRFEPRTTRLLGMRCDKLKSNAAGAKRGSASATG